MWVNSSKNGYDKEKGPEIVNSKKNYIFVHLNITQTGNARKNLEMQEASKNLTEEQLKNEIECPA